MRAALLIVGWLALAPAARAGVYNLAEQHAFVPFGDARAYVLKLRSAAESRPGVPLPESFRAQTLSQTAALERLHRQGPFASLDRVNLSGCYLRLGRAPDAVKLLLEERPDHFLLLANLASAYFQSGQLEIALNTQRAALDAWPTVWAGWNETRRLFYRDCERAFLRLIESRLEEARAGQRGNFKIDPVFGPQFRFVGPGGKYGAGAISTSMSDRMPSNGSDVVFQLVSWYPGDRRLYWLLGELLNAQGNVAPAYAIFDELVGDAQAGLFLDLAAHRRILRDAVPVYREVQEPVNRGALLGMMLAIPRPMPGAPGVGDAAYAAASCAAVAAVPHFSKPEVPDDVDPSIAAGPPLPFNWKHILAGFAFGFLVAALLGFQIQELRRRKTTVSHPG